MARTNGPDGKFQTALTPDLHRAIVDGVKSGLFDAQNALRRGIDITTLKSWVDRGLDEEAEEPFASFARDYLAASIEIEERTIAVILQAAEPWWGEKESDEESDEGSTHKHEKALHRGDWRAAAFFLERRWPLRWGVTRQPEGGPKEMLKLPDGVMNRRKRVDEMTLAPPPELIRAFRRSGYDIIKRKDPE
jgi:hypothetical protein